jgi:hypothetical protein
MPAGRSLRYRKQVPNPVIARKSTYAYKGKAPDVRQVALDLSVRYVLEGSVRRAGDRLRVTSQLIDARTGAREWADRTAIEGPLSGSVAGDAAASPSARRSTEPTKR